MSTEMQVYSQDLYPVVQDTVMTCEMIVEAAGPEGFRVNDLDRIKVPSGGNTIWNIPTPDGVEPAKHIDCIIVSIRSPRSFWARGSQSKVPDCASGDGITGHGAPGGECKSCYWNKFGTGWDEAGRQNKSKGCKETRRITFFMPGQYLPMTLLVPPGSLVRLEGEKTDITTYVRRLLSRGIPYHHVVTRLSLVAITGGPRPYAVVAFSKVADVPKEEREQWTKIRQVVDAAVNTEVGIQDEPSATADPVVAQRVYEQEEEEDDGDSSDIPF